MLKPCKYPVRAEHYALDHSVVCKHGDDNVTACGLTRRLSKGRTFGDERLGFIRRTVKKGECVADPEQIGGHAAAHATKTDEPYLHDLPLHIKPCPGLDGGNAAPTPTNSWRERVGLHGRARSPLANTCGWPLSLCDWYLALLADCFRALGKSYFQDTIVEVRFNFVLVHSVG